jgi:Sulfotransferase domain
MFPTRLTSASIRRSLARRRSGLSRSGRIFGIGLSRTGTSSLTTALNLLGFWSVHCPEDERTRKELMAYFAGGDARLRLSILEGLDAVTDSPIAASFEALDSAYPGSRFILTTREKQSWLRSYRSFWAEIGPALRANPDEPNARYIHAFNRQLYGAADLDEARFARGYDEHVRRVRAHFRHRPKDLLTIDLCAGEAWEPLCEFLGVPVPDLPFPHQKWPYREPAIKPERLLRTLLRRSASAAERV